MKNFTLEILVPIALALVAGLAGTGTANAQACLDNRQIQEAVSSGQIMSLDAVLASAGSSISISRTQPRRTGCRPAAPRSKRQAGQGPTGSC